MGGQAVEIDILFTLSTVNGINVHGRLPRPFGHHRHIGKARGHRWEKRVFERIQHSTHMANCAVAQKRHGAMGNLAFCFNLCPPTAAVTKADAVFVQRLWDNDVLHAGRGEKALFRQKRHTAIAA